ncbi:MAG: T9SS type A sorting domain-containing protein, partial [Paludibacter sp.]
INLDIYNLDGKIVKKIISNQYQNTGTYNQTICVSDLKNGIYLTTLNTGKLSQTVKLIIQNQSTN